MNPLAALTKHRSVVVFCVLIGAAAGVAAGIARKPVYSATAVANAGRIDIFSQAVPGFVAAAATLATTYSRIAVSDAVLAQVAKESGLPPAALASRIHVQPVASSSVIDVTGEGPNALAAQRLANQEVSALNNYISRLASATNAGTAELSRFQALTANVSRLVRRADRLKASLRTSLAIQNSPELSRLNIAITAAKLQAQVAANQYESSQQNSAGGTTLSVLSRATGGSSDRTSAVERYVIAGVLGGLLAALLSGLLIDERRRSRTEQAAP